jgi:hypothetical protein
MEKGDFYATSGVRLKTIRRAAEKFCIEIEPEPGVSFTTRFIGTCKGYDPGSTPILQDGKPLAATRHYSADIGKVLAEVTGPSPCYKLAGDEIYVRAKVISSKRKENPTEPGDFESAWVQPIVTGVK